MKNIFYSLLFLFPFCVFAQQTAGIVQYTEAIKLKIELPEGPEGQQFAKY